MLRGAEAAERLGDGDLAFRVYRDLASMLQHSAMPEDLVRVIDRTISSAELHGVTNPAQVYAFAAFAYATCGSREQALDLAERGVAMAAVSHDILDTISAYASRACVRAANGLLHHAITDYETALRAADESGVFLRRSVVEVNYGSCLMEMGRYREAEACLASARGIGDRENPFATANLAVLAYETGRLDTAAELAALCRVFAAKLGSLWLKSEAEALTGLVALARGARAVAEASYDTIRQDVEACIAISTDPTHVIALASRVLAMRGESDAARALLSKSLDTLRDRSVLLVKKIELERARLEIDSHPDLAYRLARSVAQMARGSGADPLLQQASAVLEEVRLRS